MSLKNLHLAKIARQSRFFEEKLKLANYFYHQVTQNENGKLPLTFFQE